MILAAVFLAGVLVGALLLGAVLAFLERDAGACGYVDLTGRPMPVQEPYDRLGERRYETWIESLKDHGP